MACGISFFTPWWLQNTPPFHKDHSNYLAHYTLTRIVTDPIITFPMLNNGNFTHPNTTTTFGMGLWAVCSGVCQWFWEQDYILQEKLFTSLKWHLACQVLYFIAFALLLFAEVYSKIQLCFRERKRHYRVLWISLLFSAILQLCALAVFGAGSYQTYEAKSYSMPYWEWKNTSTVFLGWSYWMTIPGIVLTTAAALVLLIADIWTFRDKI